MGTSTPAVSSPSSPTVGTGAEAPARASTRRPHDEALPGIGLRRRRIFGGDLKGGDTRSARTTGKPRLEAADGLRPTRDENFHGPVLTVAHPAPEPETKRLPLGGGPKPHPLNETANTIEANHRNPGALSAVSPARGERARANVG